MESIKVKIGWSGDNYSAIIEHGGAVLVTHKNLDKLKESIKESFEFHIEDEPKFKYKLDYKLQASALLKVLDKTINRSYLSKVSGVNERQLGHYAQGKREASKPTLEKITKGLRTIQKEIEEVV